MMMIAIAVAAAKEATCDRSSPRPITTTAMPSERMPRIEMLRASANRLPKVRKPFSETLKTTIRMTHITSTAVVWLGLRKRAACPTGGMSDPPCSRNRWDQR